MKLYIKLLSDLCTYSGESYNSMVDTDVVYDKYGIPYIPAKRIKGCIREAALELLEFGLISKDTYEKQDNHEKQGTIRLLPVYFTPGSHCAAASPCCVACWFFQTVLTTHPNVLHCIFHLLHSVHDGPFLAPQNTVLR